MLGGAGAAVYVSRATADASGLPRLGHVPEAVLVTQHDTPLSLSDLRGSVWVADLIFTSCSGPCLRMTSQMYRVQDELAGAEPFRLVSISVDPARDTPERLSWYADQALADADRWVFLTGEMEIIESLARDGLKLVAEPATDEHGGILHSDRFVLIDHEGVIRGYYDGLDPAAVDRLMYDARRLIDAS